MTILQITTAHALIEMTRLVGGHESRHFQLPPRESKLAPRLRIIGAKFARSLVARSMFIIMQQHPWRKENTPRYCVLTPPHQRAHRVCASPASNGNRSTATLTPCDIMATTPLLTREAAPPVSARGHGAKKIQAASSLNFATAFRVPVFCRTGRPRRRPRTLSLRPVGCADDGTLYYLVRRRRRGPQRRSASGVRLHQQQHSSAPPKSGLISAQRQQPAVQQRQLP